MSFEKYINDWKNIEESSSNKSFGQKDIDQHLNSSIMKQIMQLEQKEKRYRILGLTGAIIGALIGLGSVWLSIGNISTSLVIGTLFVIAGIVLMFEYMRKSKLNSTKEDLSSVEYLKSVRHKLSTRSKQNFRGGIISSGIIMVGLIIVLLEILTESSFNFKMSLIAAILLYWIFVVVFSSMREKRRYKKEVLPVIQEIENTLN